jgi:hypothetical protein
MKLSKSANSLVIQVQSDVAREIFPTRVTQGLISNSQEQSKNLSLFSSSDLQNKFLVLCGQLHRVVGKHKVSK